MKTVPGYDAKSFLNALLRSSGEPVTGGGALIRGILEFL